MIDLFYLQEQELTYVFMGNSPSSGNPYNCWLKPKGINWISILVSGSGGGGGGGRSGASGSARGGGGGGSTSSLSYFEYPAYLLPDRLYIVVPQGGAGGAAGAPATTGSTGAISYVLVAPTVTASAPDAVAYSSANTGGGEAGGTVGSATGGSGGGGAGGRANNRFYNLGFQTGIDTTGSGAGGLATATTNGATVTLGVIGACMIPATGGGSAFNSDSKGGTYTGNAADYRLQWMPPQSPTGGSGSNGGVILRAPSYPFLCWGGQGGGGSDAGTGGDGGNGAPGCGGGGGGGGLTGGRGGDGGPGFVIIRCY